jgi:uncharacterized SAM-binding protein YcdF (DUF218 family)
MDRMPESQLGTKPAPTSDALANRPRWRRRLGWLVLVVAILGGVLWLLSKLGHFLVIHAPERSEVLLVLEGGVGSSRFEQALRLHKAGYAPLIMVDADVTRDYYGKTEADLLLEYLQRHRLSSIEVCPTVADSTYNETKDVERCMKMAGATSAIIVTSDFHTRRALETFRKRLPQYQWSVAASSWPGNAAEQYWQHRWWAKAVLEEAQKYVWWELVDRWRSGAVLASPQAERK